jgi:peptide/nickel transport system substrate-binding protein
MDDSAEKDQSSSPETIEVRKDTPSAPSQAAAPAAPPQPVVSSDTPPPPPQAVVAHHGGGKKRWLKWLIILVVIILAAAGGYYLYNKHQDNKKSSAAGQSKDVSELKVGIVQADFGKLYPDMPASEYAYLVNSQIFEGLVKYENTNKIVPALASTWTNPDNKTWVFTIRPGIKFHDGHTLAPEDVKYSLDTIIAAKGDLADIFASTIDSVTVSGKDQVKITTKDPDPVLLNRLAFLYIIDANLPKGDEPSQAGTGPYEVKSGTKPSGTSVQLTAFNDYYGGRPKTKALAFSSSKNTEDVLKGFKAHKFNIAGPVQAADITANAGSYKFSTSEPNVEYIGFNTVKAGPLQNKLVREAIRYAVNGPQIAQAGNLEATPISQMIPPAIAGYNPSITPYKQDVAKAKQLLAQAGYPNGLTLRLSSSDNPDQTAELVKQLKAAGITATVDQHSDFDEFIDYFNGGKADMFTVNYTSDTLDGQDITTNVFGSANYDNAKLNDVLKQIAAATDPEARLKLLQQAETIIDDDVAVVPLYSETEVWIMDKNYDIQQDMPSSFLSVYFYKVQLK